ncbi:MAG: endonuclease [Bacteroidales bacterium]|nr:endonuclease [Bacteroidales bacterium]
MKIFVSRLVLFIIFSGLFYFHGFSQIPPGYYNNAAGLYGQQLKTALHNIIDNHYEQSYDDLKDILKETDEDPNNSQNVILLYTGRSQNKNTFGGGPNDWNREHVWAKSHGGFGNNPPCGTDAHHIRPTDASVNSDRGNKDFDNGGQQHPEATGCYYTEYTWEPRDAVKGDVARMILYMDVRYEGGSGEPNLTAVNAINTSPDPEHGRLNTLLEWHESDPPDAFEINRNNVIYSYQNNRNPFIDHPEYVDYIWDPPSAINYQAYSNDLNIFPVPADDFLYIDATLPAKYSFSLYNSSGQMIRTGENKNKLFPINITNLPAGIYFVEVRNGRIQECRKVVVSH